MTDRDMLIEKLRERIALLMEMVMERLVEMDHHQQQGGTRPHFLKTYAGQKRDYPRI